MPELKLAGPRYKYPVSDAELNRRLAAVQKELQSQNLDCCIAQSQCEIFDSIIRYMTDTVVHSYGTTIIIPAQGQMVLINHGVDTASAPVPPTLRNVEKVVLSPYCQTFGCTDGLAGAAISHELKHRGFKRVGVIFKQLMCADTLDSIRALMPECELVDFTMAFSYIKAVKSPEEWALIDRCLMAHQHLMEMAPALLRPGRMEYEVLADLEHASRCIACDINGNVAVGSGPNGAGVFFQRNYTANRRIQAGDGVTIMIEVSGPGGIYGELARTFCLGEPDKALVDLFQMAKEAQHAVADAAKPGVTGRELNRIFDEFVTPRGLAKNGRFVGHSQGYDMMEAPVICPTEDMEMREDMFLAIHPELVLNGQFSICCDNFRVTKEGAKRVTKNNQQIYIVEY